MCSYTVKVKVISRVNVEYQFARFQNTVCNFVDRWNTYNVLGKVTCYVCVQLIKFIYIYLFVYVLCRIKFY